MPMGSLVNERHCRCVATLCLPADDANGFVIDERDELHTGARVGWHERVDRHQQMSKRVTEGHRWRARPHRKEGEPRDEDCLTDTSRATESRH